MRYDIEPKNQKQQVIYYLLNYDEITMKDVIQDSLFYKFTSVLSSIELEYGILTSKTRVKFVNKFGRNSSFNEYNSIVEDLKLLEIYAKLN